MPHAAETMAETGSPIAAVQRSNKRKIQQHYITTNQGEPDQRESGSSVAYGDNSADSGIFYLNPLTPIWNCETSDRCLEIKSEEDNGNWVQRKETGSKRKTFDEQMAKLKLFKVKKPFLLPQISDGKSENYLGHVSSTLSEETWDQSQNNGKERIAGRRTFQHVTPTLKLFRDQNIKQSLNGICGSMDKCSDILSSQSEEKGIKLCSNNGQLKLEKHPTTFSQLTSKLKLQKVGTTILNREISNKNSGIMESHSVILSSPSEETEMSVQRKVHKEETLKEVSQKPKLTVQEELCSNPQTKQSTNGDDSKVLNCPETFSSESHENKCLKAKSNQQECVEDQEDKNLAENDKQVTSKLKDLQVKENQLDGAKVKRKDDSKISRLLEAMKKRSEIDTEERPFKCPHCHWAFKKLCYLQSHITTHSGLKPHVCDICGKAYSHQGTLQQHKRLHTGERPYHCPFCDRSYIWSSDYRKHIRTHTGEKPYECKECGKDFIRSSDLRKHERNMHTNNKPFPCSLCDKTFNRPLSLKRHERKHLGERPFSCPDCGKKFALASRMAEHQKVHKGVRPFVCSVCGKSFTKSSNLTEHEAIHSGIRPHKCEECGVAFAMASRLVRHQYVHNKGKPYTCGGCDRNFSCLTSLEQHQQLKCAGRIFVCVQCDKSFTCAEKLTQHMQHHNDKTGPN